MTNSDRSTEQNLTNLGLCSNGKAHSTNNGVGREVEVEGLLSLGKQHFTKTTGAVFISNF